MHSIHRSLFAAAALLSAAAGPAMAQATVGPAGAIPSTTAPANGEGTPAGGTGTISTTRVGPSSTAAARPVRHYRARRHHVAHATKPVAATPASTAPATPAPATTTPSTMAPTTPATQAPSK
jgi:5'-nucleotidase